MKRSKSTPSRTKQIARHTIRVSGVLCLVFFAIMAAGAGYGAHGQASGESGGALVENVAAQSDESGSSGSYNISNTDFGNQPVKVDEEVQVIATITNTGNNQLSTAIGLGTQGQVVDSQEVSLFPGSSQQVSFSYTYDSPGTYTMQIGTLNESDVMIQVDQEDSNVRVVERGASTDVSGQVGTSATTGREVSGIPTISQDEETTGDVSIGGTANSLTATNLKVASGSPPFRPGELISFQSNVSNPTSQQLNGSFTFAVDNGTVSQQMITVPAGESQSLVFTHRFAGPGTYTISVGDRTRNITIQPAPTTAGQSSNVTATTANASSGGSNSGGGGIFDSVVGSFAIILATVSVVVIGIAIAAFVWYRTTTSPETMNR